MVDVPATSDAELEPQESQPRESLWATVRRDFERATGRRVIAVLGVLAWMAFQWGWGNDILLPPIVARSFASIDDGESWPSGIAAVVAATGSGSAFWAFTQTLDVAIVLNGLRLVPGVTERISRFLRRSGWIKPFDELSRGTRFLIAYGSGASVLCLVDAFATGNPGTTSRMRMVAHAVGLAVAGVAITIIVITIALAIGARIPATASAATIVVRYARNPLTWLVFYGSIVGGSALLSRLSGGTAPQHAA